VAWLVPRAHGTPHDEAVVVRRAQLGTKPGHPLKEGNERAWKDHLYSLAAALPGTKRVLARQGWAGEKSGLFEQFAGSAGYNSSSAHSSESDQ
jgi:hypothetical protein